MGKISDETIRFWDDESRNPRSVILAAWMSEVMFFQRWMGQVDHNKSFINVGQAASKITSIFELGPRFGALGDSFVSAIPPVNETYIAVCEQKQKVDSEIDRLVNKLRAARDLFAKSSVSAFHYDMEIALKAADVIYTDVPADFIPGRRLPYRWADECRTAKEVILALWNSGISRLIESEDYLFRDKFVDIQQNGPRVNERLFAAVPALKRDMSLSFAIDGIESAMSAVELTMSKGPYGDKTVWIDNKDFRGLVTKSKETLSAALAEITEEPKDDSNPAPAL